MNLKDNSAYFDLPELVDAKVDSLKIEGRIKGAHYVYTVTDTWRKQVDQFVETGKLLADDSNLHRVFNRDFTNSFLQGDLTKDMFIDSPRDYSVQHAVQKQGAVSVVHIEEVKKELYSKRNALGDELTEKIKYLSIAKQPLTLAFSGKLDEPLCLTMVIGDNDKVHTLYTESKLSAANKMSIDRAILEKRFKNLATSGFTLEDFDCSDLDKDLSLPLKELTVLKNSAALWLNNSVELIPHVDVPKLVKSLAPTQSDNSKPTLTLSILIADVKDIPLCDLTRADVYFKLPESWKKGCNKHIDIFLENPRLIPWFPAVLIGKDYDESVRLLEHVRPERIVSNNTGVAYKAFEMSIEWIAGPFFKYHQLLRPANLKRRVKLCWCLYFK